MRIFAALVALGLLTTPAKAQVRYDRMHWACGEMLMCHIMVDGMAFDDGLYLELQQRGYITAIDRMSVMHDRAKLIREYFPDAWEGQDCPMGNCRAFRAPLPIEARQALWNLRRQRPICKAEEEQHCS